MIAALAKARAGGDASAPVRPAVTKQSQTSRRPSETEAASKPISFNAAMARALLAGQKTETRRPIRPLPTGETVRDDQPWPIGPDGEPMACRLAVQGERLWVREPWAVTADGVAYEADLGPAQASDQRWRPGRFMAKANCRLFLDVTQVAAERLSQITAASAEAEGFPPGLFHQKGVAASDRGEAALVWFRQLWDSIYAGSEFAWAEDPWVWVIGFKLRQSGQNRAGKK